MEWILRNGYNVDMGNPTQGGDYMSSDSAVMDRPNGLPMRPVEDDTLSAEFVEDEEGYVEESHEDLLNLIEKGVPVQSDDMDEDVSPNSIMSGEDYVEDEYAVEERKAGTGLGSIRPASLAR